MQPVTTDRSNVRLTLPGGTATNDLPAERVELVNPDRPLDPPEPGFESLWAPDEHEREAIATGAGVILRIWGSAHPPVSLSVPDVDSGIRALARDHADRAMGALLGLMHDAGMLTEPPGELVGRLAELWQRAIDATALNAVVDQLAHQASDYLAEQDPGHLLYGKGKVAGEEPNADEQQRTPPQGDPLSRLVCEHGSKPDTCPRCEREAGR